MPVNAEQFWAFSLSTYANKEVSAYLLKWQDEFGLNINLLLLCHYLDTQHTELDKPALSTLSTTLSEDIGQPVLRFRASRKALKSELGMELYALVRENLLSAELALEREEQKQLINCLDDLSLSVNSHHPAQGNVRLYADSRAIPQQDTSLFCQLINTP